MEKLLSKGYKSKIRGNQEFTDFINDIERDMEAKNVQKYENLSKKEVS